MNLRHAAVLALVGWYLMVAPTQHIGPFISVEKKHPISEWNRQDQFDSRDIVRQLAQNTWRIRPCHCANSRTTWSLNAYQPMIRA